MPAPAGAAGAVLAGAERIVAEEQARELERERRKARRKALQEEKQRLAREKREQEAAARKAEDEWLRAAAGETRRALLERVRELGELCGGSILAVFEGIPDPRDPRGVRHSLPCILALVTMAMLRGKTTMTSITAWITRGGPGTAGRVRGPHRAGRHPGPAVRQDRGQGPGPARRRRRR